MRQPKLIKPQLRKLELKKQRHCRRVGGTASGNYLLGMRTTLQVSRAEEERVFNNDTNYCFSGLRANCQKNCKNDFNLLWTAMEKVMCFLMMILVLLSTVRILMQKLVS